MVNIVKEISEVPKDKLVVIDFFATWCGPCKQIAPIFEDLSKKFVNIIFLKNDAGDDDESLALHYDVQKLPTFVFIRNDKVIKSYVGINEKEIISNLEELNVL